MLCYDVVGETVDEPLPRKIIIHGAGRLSPILRQPSPSAWPAFLGVRGKATEGIQARQLT